jgi:hypothetical protein
MQYQQLPFQRPMYMYNYNNHQIVSYCQAFQYQSQPNQNLTIYLPTYPIIIQPNQNLIMNHQEKF